MRSIYPIPLADFAITLGISPTALKKLRDEKLAPEDWQVGHPSLIHETGAEKIRAALALPPPPEAVSAGADVGTAGAEKNAASGHVATPGERIALRVRRVPKPSSPRAPARILFCDPPPGCALPEVRLQVKSTHNFLPGMVCKTCTAHHTIPGYFQFEGRMPRYRGRF